MAYKFQLGSLTQEGAVEVDALTADSMNLQSGGITNAGSIAGATSIDGSGDLTMGTITMTGFSVDADGDTALKSLAIDNSSTIGCDGDTDIMTLGAQALTLANDVDFNVAKTSGLQLGGVAVSSTAAELNLLDTAAAGTIVNSIAVIYGSSGEVNGTSFELGGSEIISSAGNFQGNNASFGEVTSSGGLLVSGSGGASIISNGTVEFQGVADATISLTADSLYFKDGDGTMKSDTIADIAALLAGDGIEQDGASKVLKVKVDASTIEINSDTLRVKDDGVTGAKLNDDVISAQTALASGLALTDEFLVSDAGTLKRMDVSVLAEAIDGAGLSNNAGLLDVDAAQTGITSILNDSLKLGRGDGNDAIDFGTDDQIDFFIDGTGANDLEMRISSGSVTVYGNLNVQGTTTTIDSTTIAITGSIAFEGSTADGNETTLGVIDPTGDRSINLPNCDGTVGAFSDSSWQTGASAVTTTELAILDGANVTTAELTMLDGSAKSTSSITIADADGFIIIDGNTTKQIPASDLKSYVSDAALTVHAAKSNGDTLAAGVNFFASSSIANTAVDLPASPSAGDQIFIKAMENCGSTRLVTISKQGSHTIDGETSIVLESPFAAVQCVFVGNNEWKIF